MPLILTLLPARLHRMEHLRVMWLRFLIRALRLELWPMPLCPAPAFHPHEFDVELSQTSLAEADELLKSTLDEAMRAIGGTRAFLALVDTVSGELVLRFTAGDGWTDDIRRLRVNMRAVKEEQSKNKARARAIRLRHWPRRWGCIRRTIARVSRVMSWSMAAATGRATFPKTRITSAFSMT
jgi:hypothetical protein